MLRTFAVPVGRPPLNSMRSSGNGEPTASREHRQRLPAAASAPALRQTPARRSSRWGEAPGDRAAQVGGKGLDEAAAAARAGAGRAGAVVADRASDPPGEVFHHHPDGAGAASQPVARGVAHQLGDHQADPPALARIEPDLVGGDP